MLSLFCPSVIHLSQVCQVSSWLACGSLFPGVISLSLHSFCNLALPTFRTLITVCTKVSQIYTYSPGPLAELTYLFLGYLKDILFQYIPNQLLFHCPCLSKWHLYLSISVKKTMSCSWNPHLPSLLPYSKSINLVDFYLINMSQIHLLCLWYQLVQPAITCIWITTVVPPQPLWSPSLWGSFPKHKYYCDLPPASNILMAS